MRFFSLMTISFFLFPLSPAYAEPTHWLMGISGGFAGRSSNASATVIYTNANPPFAGIPPITVIEDYDDSGYTWGLLVGYQAECDGWILGGELSVDWEDIAENHPFAFSDVAVLNNEVGLAWNGNFRYERDIVIGLTARFGYELESLLYFFPPVFIPYFRIGLEFSKDSIQASYSGFPEVYPFSASSKHQHWPYRYVFGIGTEFPIKCSNAAIRMEFDYRSAGQTLETDSNIVDGLIINPIFTTGMNPVVKAGKISLVWNFY